MTRGELWSLGVLVGVWILGGVGVWLWDQAGALPTLSPLWVDEKGAWLHARLTPDEKWRFRPPPHAIAWVAPLLLAKEDQQFYYHPGVNPWSLLRAAWHFIKGGPRQGGSTLTMQLAQLRHPGPRTLRQKLWQIVYALALELRYDKQTILEMYLTQAPFGQNIEGIEAAAWFYFGKRTENLNALEIASLLLLSQRPRLVKAFLTQERAFRDRALFWVKRWHGMGLLSAGAYQEALAAPLSPRRRPFPFLDPPPKLLWAISQRAWDQAPDTLFLDKNLQDKVLQRLRLHLAAAEGCHITQGAVFIAEVPSGRVRVYIGSCSYRSCAYDLWQVPRSPGSTLKPFLWLIGLESQHIGSKTPLLDVPVSFGGYLPVNFQSNQWRGLVSADEALQLSLNVPAVGLLRQVGLELFRRRLAQAGLMIGAEAGLGAAIGAAEVRGLELVQAYTALANRGRVTRLRLTSRMLDTTWQVFSPPVTWILYQMLPKAGPGWVYKTGTSTRLRDAWCLAYSTRYVVGVWLGNPDARSSACLRGGDLALPLLVQVIALLGPQPDPDRPSSVVERSICRLSGQAPAPDCPDTIREYALRPDLARCRHWITYYLSRDSAYLPDCLPSMAEGLALRRIERLPPQVAALWGKLPSQLLPPLAARCQIRPQVAILFPPEGTTLWLRRADTVGIPLLAAANAPVPLSWSVNGQLIRSPLANQSALYYRPPPLDTTLRFCCQAQTAQTCITCRVRWME